MGHPTPDTPIIKPEMAPLPRIAVPFLELLATIDLPESTYRKETAEGRGCRTFKIGRRKYVLMDDWEAWLRERADVENEVVL
ncbi:hypothetical protein [Shimia thalassica]|uniref:hypothetical protein n=1 Tax=Shimia thalassica TaxID=1715693 RepID=UPI0027337CEC|nr:hypothetical protein [Shimia thalassica]MDP2518833.1 hypothetical protein [Shimia thalassica]